MNIVNIVCEYKLIGCIETSNLNKTEKFSGYTIRDGKNVCRVYKNGYCIVTGITEVASADRLIRENFPLNPIITRKIILVTGSGKIPFKFSFSSLLKWHSLNRTRSHLRYEGEIFPALYWLKEPETIYFFPSGSAIITGAKSIDRIEHVWREFLSELWSVHKECSQFILPVSNDVGEL